MLAHSQKCKPWCTISQLTICQQRSNDGPTVRCSDTLHIRWISVPTISQPFAYRTIPNTTFFQRFAQTVNDGPTNCTTWVTGEPIEPCAIAQSIISIMHKVLNWKQTEMLNILKMGRDWMYNLEMTPCRGLKYTNDTNYLKMAVKKVNAMYEMAHKK